MSSVNENSHSLLGKQFGMDTAYGKLFVAPGSIKDFIHYRTPQLFPEDSLLFPLEATMSEIVDLDKRLYAPSVTRCFGLESRVAHFVTEKSADMTAANPRKLLIRPAVEPIIYSYWARLRDWSIDPSSISAMASCLCGRDTSFRVGACAAMPDRLGVSVLYPEVDGSGKWLYNIPKPKEGCSIRDSLRYAFMAYAMFITYHPLVDGNGRVGRAIFQGVLGRTLGLSGPMLALGPFFYSNYTAAVSGHVQLGCHGEWAPFIGAYHKMLNDCLSYHRQLLEGS